MSLNGTKKRTPRSSPRDSYMSPFNSIPVSMINMITEIDNKTLNIGAISVLLRAHDPFTGGHIVYNSRRQAQIHPGVSGIITNKRSDPITSGMFSGGKLTVFRNAIIINVSCDDDYIAGAKVCNGKIQVYGMKSTHSIIKCVDSIVDNIRYIVRVVEAVWNNHHRWDDILDDLWGMIDDGDYGPLMDNYLDSVSGDHRDDDVDGRYNDDSRGDDVDDIFIIDYLLGKCHEFRDADAYCEFLEWISRLHPDDIIHGDISVVSHLKAGINYNYTIGTEVDLNALAEEMRKIDGMIVIFDPDIEKFLRVVIYFDNLSQSAYNIIVCKRSPHATLMVYKTGSVTQSAPCTLLSEMVYNMFSRLIHDRGDLFILSRSRTSRIVRDDDESRYELMCLQGDALFSTL